MAPGTVVYVAKHGDYLVKIASEHGTTWQAIWNHPLNAEHRRRRSSPDVLHAGDALHVPSVASPGDVPHPSGPPPSLDTPPPTPYWPYGPTPSHITLDLQTKPTWRSSSTACSCDPARKEPTTEEHIVFMHDDQARRMPGALCRVHLPGGVPKILVADHAGAICLDVPLAAATTFLEWGAPTPEPGYEPYRKRYRFGLGAEHVRELLAHVGVSRSPLLAEQVYEFQLAYRLPPTDGDARSLGPVLYSYHSMGMLPPLPEDDASGPAVPLPADIRSANQGAVSAVSSLHEGHIRVQLVTPAGAPIANTSYILRLPQTSPIEGTTNSNGYLDAAEAPLGDHRLELDDASLFVSASHRSDTTRRVVVVF